MTNRQKWFALIAVVALVSGSASPVRADTDGPGTRFMACRDEAHADLGRCYSGADGYWDQVGCNLAWEIDLLGCDRQVIRDLM